jgi:hypothetical protein
MRGVQLPQTVSLVTLGVYVMGTSSLGAAP